MKLCPNCHRPMTFEKSPTPEQVRDFFKDMGFEVSFEPPTQEQIRKYLENTPERKAAPQPDREQPEMTDEELAELNGDGTYVCYHCGSRISAGEPDPSWI